jgi:hypothetical protein
MKSKKITVCIVNSKDNTVSEQVDLNVPDIFNVYEICDACNEVKNNSKLCNNCIVRLLQSEKYII